MTCVHCSIDERHANPLFELFDGGDSLFLSSYRDVEAAETVVQVFVPDEDGAYAPPEKVAAARAALVAAGRALGLDLRPETMTFPDEDWKLSYRKHFKTDSISPRIAVVPAWEADGFKPFFPGQRALVMDPGLAFGTGKHETTRACLEFIDELAAENADRSFLDVGCGSGILAVAASLLGFKDVRGFDLDPEAVDVARETASANGVAVEFFRGDLSGIMPGNPSIAPARVVAANVLGPVLAKFAPQIAAMVDRADDARLVLSGILEKDYGEVAAAFAAQGFQEISSKVAGEWKSGLFARHD